MLDLERADGRDRRADRRRSARPASCTAPRARTVTVTFGGFRRGHLLARDEVGDVVVVDIGHPPADPAWPALVTDASPPRGCRRLRRRDHKGERGRVVIVGGDAGMTGARAHGRARGASARAPGLVHVVAPPETVAALVQAEPDLQTLAQRSIGRRATSCWIWCAAPMRVVIGPGLGRDGGPTELVARAGRARRAAVVLDADALVGVPGRGAPSSPRWRRAALVLTPHPGRVPHAVSRARVRPRARSLGARRRRPPARSGATVLLKGVPTVIARDGPTPLTVAAGNPGLATGGSGDVLSGIVGTALAQGIAPEVAAALGAQVLGRAADLAARRGSRAVAAADGRGRALPDLWREWECCGGAAGAAAAGAAGAGAAADCVSQTTSIVR